MSDKQKSAASMKKAVWIVLPIVIIAVVVVAVFAGQSNSLSDQIAQLEADKAALSQDMDMAVRTAKELADTFGELRTFETYTVAFNDLKAGAIDAIAIDMTAGAFLISGETAE